jgi:hypothetical protein
MHELCKSSYNPHYKQKVHNTAFISKFKGLKKYLSRETVPFSQRCGKREKVYMKNRARENMFPNLG